MTRIFNAFVAFLFIIALGFQLASAQDQLVTKGSAKWMKIKRHPKFYGQEWNETSLNEFLVVTETNAFQDTSSFLRNFSSSIAEEFPDDHIEFLEGTVVKNLRFDFPAKGQSTLNADGLSVYIISTNQTMDKFGSFVYAILRNENVRYVEPNHVVSAYGYTQKVDYKLWHLDVLSNRDNFKLNGVYFYNYTGRGVIVHVLDSGVYVDHSEFEGRASIYFTCDRYKDDCQEGNDDCLGHGSAVAGVIAGRTHGVAKKALIYSSKVLNRHGQGTTADVLEALKFISQSESNFGSIINLSLGGVPSYTLNRLIFLLTNEMRMIFVVAAGNSKRDACLEGPANSPDAITVASHNIQGVRSSFSNYGNCVDFYAPGEGVRSLFIHGPYSYRFMSGTSFAAPCVAGIAAQLLQQNPSFSPAHIRRVLSRTAKGTRVKNFVDGSSKAVSSNVALPCHGLVHEFACIPLKGYCLEPYCDLDPSLKNQTNLMWELDENAKQSIKFYRPFFTSFKQSMIFLYLYDNVMMEEKDSHFDLQVYDKNDGSLVEQSTDREYPLMIDLEVNTNKSYLFRIVKRTRDRLYSSFVLYIEAPRHCMDVFHGDPVCSDRGVCDKASGKCLCADGFEGVDCGSSTWDNFRKQYRGWWYKWLLGDIHVQYPLPSVVLSSIVVAGTFAARQIIKHYSSECYRGYSAIVY